MKRYNFPFPAPHAGEGSNNDDPNLQQGEEDRRLAHRAPKAVLVPESANQAASFEKDSSGFWVRVEEVFDENNAPPSPEGEVSALPSLDSESPYYIKGYAVKRVRNSHQFSRDSHGEVYDYARLAYGAKPYVVVDRSFEKPEVGAILFVTEGADRQPQQSGGGGGNSFFLAEITSITSSTVMGNILKIDAQGQTSILSAGEELGVFGSEDQPLVFQGDKTQVAKIGEKYYLTGILTL